MIKEENRKRINSPYLKASLAFKFSPMLLSIFFLMFFCSILEAQKPMVAIVDWDPKAKEGSDHAEVRIIQIGDPVPDLEVQIVTSGSATNGFDYRSFGSTFRMGKMSKIKILPAQDPLLEGDETLVIRLLESPAYTIEPNHDSVVVTIQDEALPDIEFIAPCSVDDESKEKVELKILLSKAFGEEILLDYTVEGVLAKRGEDFLFEPGTLVIPSGSTEASLDLNIINDSDAEDDETVVIRLTEARNANIGTNDSHYYTIRNDDGELSRSIVHDRIFGALIGFRAGCSMGAFTEYNLPQKQLYEFFGHVDDFFPFVHYGDTWSHPAGSTEDGGERHKLICTAIMEKQDRIDANDLLKVWLRDCNIEDMNHMTQPYDRILLGYAKWGVPPADMPATKYGSPYDLGEHIHLTSRTFQAIPCINAGDPENAILDMNDLGRLYYENPNDDAFAWGAVYNAAMALAILPDATIESVIEGALEYATPEIEEEIRYALAITEKYDNPMDRSLWKELSDMYVNPDSRYYAFNRIDKYINSSVYENVSYAMALFKATRANVEQSVIIATNRGYDTDCTAASAGALCGAFSGTENIPSGWIQILDEGIARTPYTNAHFTNKATADGLYRALQSKLHRMQAEVREMKNESMSKGSEEVKKMEDYIDLMRKSGVIN